MRELGETESATFSHGRYAEASFHGRPGSVPRATGYSCCGGKVVFVLFLSPGAPERTSNDYENEERWRMTLPWVLAIGAQNPSMSYQCHTRARQRQARAEINHVENRGNSARQPQRLAAWRARRTSAPRVISILDPAARCQTGRAGRELHATGGGTQLPAPHQTLQAVFPHPAFRGRSPRTLSRPPLRRTTQCPLKRANLSRRCYLPPGSHRAVLPFAVHLDQVRPLRSSLVTTFLATMGRSDFSLGRVGLPRSSGVVPGVWPAGTRGDLSICCPQLCRHPMLAYPAARLTGPIVILASPILHRVCQRPAHAAFTGLEAVRLRGCLRLTGLIG